MYHSLSFQTLDANDTPIRVFNTYRDLFLVPTSRPMISTPSVKTHYVDIPGAYGSLDLTESLAGRVLYGNCTGSIEFAIYSDAIEWIILYNRMLDYIHGKKAYMVLEDAKTLVYEGRWAMDGWSPNEGLLPHVTLSYTLEPFAKSINDVSGLANAIANSW